MAHLRVRHAGAIRPLDERRKVETKFKVGDRVRVVRLWEPHGYKIGDIGIIDEIHENTGGGKQLGAHVTWGDGRNRSYLSILHGEIELAPAPLFKPGDRVEYTGAYNNMDDHMIGMVGSVVALEDPNNVRVKWDKKGTFCTGILPGNLKLIETKREFKKGDRVRYIGGSDGMKYRIGQLATVTGRNWRGPIIEYDGGGENWTFDEYLELVDDAEITKPAKSKTDELFEALTAAKAKVQAAREREDCAEKELSDARKELFDAEMAARAAQEAIFQAA
jgi:hypothetical protein